MKDHFGPFDLPCPVCGAMTYLPAHPTFSAQHGRCPNDHHFYHYDGHCCTDEEAEAPWKS